MKMISINFRSTILDTVIVLFILNEMGAKEILCSYTFPYFYVDLYFLTKGQLQWKNHLTFLLNKKL